MPEDGEADRKRPCGVRLALGVDLLTLEDLVMVGRLVLVPLEVLEALEALEDFLGDDLKVAMMDFYEQLASMVQGTMIKSNKTAERMLWL